MSHEYVYPLWCLDLMSTDMESIMNNILSFSLSLAIHSVKVVVRDQLT